MEPEAIDLCPHGQQYEVLQGLVGPEHGRVRYSDRFFYPCFPTTIVAASVEWTNEKIRESSHVQPLTKGEFFKFLGIRLCMVLSPLRGGIDAFYATIQEEEEETVLGA